jgi:hypothetical protein
MHNVLEIVQCLKYIRHRGHSGYLLYLHLLASSFHCNDRLVNRFFFVFVTSGIIANVPLTVFCMSHIQQKVHNLQCSFHIINQVKSQTFRESSFIIAYIHFSRYKKTSSWDNLHGSIFCWMLWSNVYYFCFYSTFHY